jgi:hypothetical protein
MPEAQPGDSNYISDRPLEKALEVHAVCVKSLSSIPCEDQRNVLESVSRFLAIPVEPPVSELANLLVQTVGAALETYRASGQPAPAKFTGGQGTESIVSLLAKMMKAFPPEQAQKLRDFVVALTQETYGGSPYRGSSSESPSDEASDEEQAPPG